MLQRLLQPLSLLLKQYLWVSPRHPSPPIFLPLTMMASPRCQTSGAALEPPRPPWLVSHPRNPPPQNRSSLHSESPFKMVFRHPTTPWLSLKRIALLWWWDVCRGRMAALSSFPNPPRPSNIYKMLQSTAASPGSSWFSFILNQALLCSAWSPYQHHVWLSHGLPPSSSHGTSFTSFPSRGSDQHQRGLTPSHRHTTWSSSIPVVFRQMGDFGHHQAFCANVIKCGLCSGSHEIQECLVN